MQRNSMCKLASARNERRLAEEGYRFYASESAEFAQASAPAVAEAVVACWAGHTEGGSETW